MKQMTVPHPDLAIASIPDHGGTTLYAYMAQCMLYMTVRIISAQPIVNRRRSFWLAWDIENQKLVKPNSKDMRDLPAEIKSWAVGVLSDYFPDHATATGLSPAEVAELRAEQKRKREAHAVSQSGKNSC